MCSQDRVHSKHMNYCDTTAVDSTSPLNLGEEKSALKEDMHIFALLNMTPHCRQGSSYVKGFDDPSYPPEDEVSGNDEKELVHLAMRIELLALRRSNATVGAGDRKSKAELLYQRGRAVFAEKGQWRAAEVQLVRPNFTAACIGRCFANWTEEWVASPRALPQCGQHWQTGRPAAEG